VLDRFLAGVLMRYLIAKEVGGCLKHFADMLLLLLAQLQ